MNASSRSGAPSWRSSAEGVRASRDVPSRAGAFERTEEHHTDDDAGTEEYELSSGARTAGFQFHVVLEMLICYGDVLNRT